MLSKVIVLIVLVATVLVMSELAAGRRYPNGHKCKTYNNCYSRCCVNNTCVKNSEWCPCSNINNQCNRTMEVCIPQEVVCVRAPCYPVPTCQPRYLPVKPLQLD